MSIPDHIAIGPYVYEIRQDQDVLDEADHWGHIRYANHLIRVSQSVPVSRQRVVLVHEMLHAIFEYLGQGNHEWEESVVTALAPALLEALRRNPEVVRYLMEPAP